MGLRVVLRYAQDSKCCVITKSKVVGPGTSKCVPPDRDARKERGPGELTENKLQ